MHLASQKFPCSSECNRTVGVPIWCGRSLYSAVRHCSAVTLVSLIGLARVLSKCTITVVRENPYRSPQLTAILTLIDLFIVANGVIFQGPCLGHHPQDRRTQETAKRKTLGAERGIWAITSRYSKRREKTEEHKQNK
ncbi:unnamed protein product [Sphacelaria rigidula]